MNLPPAAGYPPFFNPVTLPKEETLTTAMAKLILGQHMARIDTAMCVWEAILTQDHIGFKTEQGKAFSASVDKYRGYYGSASLRNEVATVIAPWVDSVWNAADADLRDRMGAFDWDFIPNLLTHCIRFDRDKTVFLPWEG